MKEIQDLVTISRYYGQNPDFVIAGGGNTSYKDGETMWIKASGTTLADIGQEGFAMLDLDKVYEIGTKSYSDEPAEREQEIKIDLYRSSLEPEKMLRPSVETSLHAAINWNFVVHTHPTVVNALLCSKQAKAKVRDIFGDRVIYIPYTDPGYVLYKKVENELRNYRITYGNNAEPHVIFLQNHGIFVAADSIAEIKQIYTDVIAKIAVKLAPMSIDPLPIDERAAAILPAIRMMLTPGKSVKIAAIRNDTLIADFGKDASSMSGAMAPFTPDIIVYCKARPIYVENTATPEEAIDEFDKKLKQYRKSYKYDPKMVMLKDIGLVAVEDNWESAQTALDVYEDLLKISRYTHSFGGPRFLNDREISFIDNWEVENYRRAVAKGKSVGGAVDNKIAIVTGGAQGFGGGIAEQLMERNAHVVVADLNEEAGKQMVDRLNKKAGKNRAVFVKCDVASDESVKQLIHETVMTFGGLDVFISNAGILRAGGLDEMTADVFELMTKVNYTGYFICAKHASALLKLQSQHKKGYLTDIIQINSKSGLKGSNKNFAYAGGKFGGIGLTQSFAMELMPYGIKVNSVCPGNFLDGPLWSDPEKGLFVQYLQAGKVPGATTVADVKAYYESQVPAGRGCTIDDVMKAVLYIIDQEYETGQAVPVTGGQQMLK